MACGEQDDFGNGLSASSDRKVENVRLLDMI